MASVMNGGANGTFIPMDPCYIQNANLSKFNNTLDNTGINCWTLYKDYNENMAETFCKGFATNNFVAIKTTFLHLISAFPAAFKEMDSLFCGKIEYHYDYFEAQIPLHKKTDWLFHMSAQKYKREREFRFVFLLDETWNETQYLFDSKRKLDQSDIILKCLRSNIIIKEGQKIGFHIPVNLNALKMVIYCPSQNTLNNVIGLLNKRSVYTQTATTQFVQL